VSVEEPGPNGERPHGAREPAPARSLATWALVTIGVTALSYAAPEQWAATAVGAAFFGATYGLVLRGDSATIRAAGLSLGGLLEPEPLSRDRLVREGARAVGWSLGLIAIIAPLFWLGAKAWFSPNAPFSIARAMPTFDQVLGQLLVIALPEEAFFRGYLQSELERTLARRVVVFGLPVTLGNLVASGCFAFGHMLTIPNPSRLAVFFPSLLFGALRSKTGGIGGGVVLHALCNLLSAFVLRGFGIIDG
jgi:membrane protease YdiL (CAAX protease family)